MDHLNIERRKALKESLGTLAGRLRDEIAGRMFLPNHNTETDDAAVANLETDLDVADLERSTRQLRAVEAALERLEGPDFGLCEDCYAPIPFARLSANPMATRCTACQSLVEKT